MTTKRRKALRTFECPECQQKAVLQRILYGMPGEDFDYTRFASGGCIVEAGQPDIACKACGWTGHRYFLENPDDIRDITDIIF